MVPSAFMMLNALPLTPNGKVDRQALPALDQSHREREKAFVAPRDALELQLTKMWEEVLGTQPIGVRDNFFGLGGHSLLAVHLFAQIEKRLSKKLPLATLFLAPTIAQLADVIRQEEWSSLWSSLVAIQPGGSKPPFFCVHECGGYALFYRHLAHYLGPDQPFFGLQAVGLDGTLPHSRIEDMATHYLKEIRTVQPAGPYFIGGSGMGGMVAFEMAQQLLGQGQRVSLLVFMDTGPPRAQTLGAVRPRARRSLRHYLRRSAYHLQRRQFIPAFKNVLMNYFRRYYKNYYQKYYRKLFVSRDLQRVSEALSKAPLRYVPKLYPGRITYFLAEKRRGRPNNPRTRIGSWYEVAAGGLDVHVVPGNHIDFLKEPHVRVLAEKLTACLAQTQADEGFCHLSQWSRGSGFYPRSPRSESYQDQCPNTRQG